MDPLPHLMDYDAYAPAPAHWKRLYLAEAREHDALRRQAREMGHAMTVIACIVGVVCLGVGYFAGRGVERLWPPMAIEEPAP